MLVFENFPEGIVISEICSDSNSEITSVMEIANSGVNLVSHRKVFSSHEIWDMSRPLSMATTRRGTFV